MIKRWLGLDVVDVIIQLGVTFSLMGAVAASDGPVEVQPLILAASLAVLGIRRALAVRHVSTSSGEFTAERLGEVEERLRDFEVLQSRVLELEERLDFAERLLARPQESPDRIPAR